MCRDKVLQVVNLITSFDVRLGDLMMGCLHRSHQSALESAHMLSTSIQLQQNSTQLQQQQRFVGGWLDYVLRMSLFSQRTFPALRLISQLSLPSLQGW